MCMFVYISICECVCMVAYMLYHNYTQNVYIMCIYILSDIKHESLHKIRTLTQMKDVVTEARRVVSLST